MSGLSKQASQRVSRPAGRYRPGKAPVQVACDDDGQRIGDQRSARQHIQELGNGVSALTTLFQRQRRNKEEPRTAGVVVSVGSAPVKLPLSMSRTIKREDEEPEYETDTDDGHDQQTAADRRIGVFSTVRKEALAPSSDYEAESSDEEEEEESEPEPMFKPIFIPKKQREAEARNRAASSAQHGSPSQSKARQAADDEDDQEGEAERLAAARRLEAQQLASERIKAELLAKQSEEAKPDLDDTDGLDPEAEFAAWRIRELRRIKREWEAEEAKEQEEQERARRAAMTEAERDAEDTARAEAGRKEAREQRGKMVFMQKYYHKGAFFQDLDILKKHDYRTEDTEGTIPNKESLPKMLQVRDGDVGKKGRSKWTHLGAEDTSKDVFSLKSLQRARDTSIEGGASRGAGGVSEGCFHCGATDHLKRDCMVFAEEREKQKGIRQREFDRDRHRPRPPREDRDDTIQDRWRSRSPPPRRQGYGDERGDGPHLRPVRSEYDYCRTKRHSCHPCYQEGRRRDSSSRSLSPAHCSRPSPSPPPRQPPPVRDRWAERQRLEREQKERRTREGAQRS